jgi:hypothetical protein
VWHGLHDFDFPPSPKFHSHFKGLHPFVLPAKHTFVFVAVAVKSGIHFSHAVFFTAGHESPVQELHEVQEVDLVQVVEPEQAAEAADVQITSAINKVTKIFGSSIIDTSHSIIHRRDIKNMGKVSK